ncbi:multidrug efflux SMR transporter [Priestia filamentosa]|jgi:paired small multidrug resistance pump|uniref:Paired small multidrug resistance pump n=1 Tax=Priestia endophytica DSM 13796 TaxID=1121089 RepID=A0A1I6B6L1_9BACI|nr:MULTISPECIES: multidrug efflux SMR transporter [Priestia]KYG26737.1 transporter [Priestia endophytica]MBG9813017.1 transporter [Priestia endophytica]MED3728568.1 multidrug efflux SMR transporter [Priestia filamentosa]UOE62549.1 multidrug efflux SMR transporter [Priestia filamentosa]SFQ76571.1 paired small multidrug resistance pump [Priestia endophytica DSM 13796]
MAWGFLIVAGLCEVLGVFGLKRVTIRKDVLSLLMLIASFALSFTMLSLAMRDLPMGTAYAIWTGIGTVGATLVGMFVYKEPKEWRRILFISMILCSAIGLKLLG